VKYTDDKLITQQG